MVRQVGGVSLFTDICDKLVRSISYYDGVYVQVDMQSITILKFGGIPLMCRCVS